MPRTAWNVNLFGTMNLAEAVMRHAPEARFVPGGIVGGLRRVVQRGRRHGRRGRAAYSSQPLRYH